MRGKTMEHAQKRKINFKGILTSSRTKRVPSPTLSPLTPRMRCGMRISVIHVRSPPTWLKRMV